MLSKFLRKGGLIAGVFLSASTLMADDRVEYIGRVGWYGMRATQLSTQGFSEGYLWGSSDFHTATQTGYASWVADVAALTTHRIGLFTDPEFTAANRSVNSFTDGVLPSALAYGHSQRYVGNATNGMAAWVADAATGITTRIGLFEGPEYTGSNSYQNSEIKAVTQSGYVAGRSSRYVGSSGNSAAWVANARTGVTSRVGIYSGNSSLQSCDVVGLSENGYVAGNSFFRVTEQYAWVANAATGTTTRVGLFSGEFSGSLANMDDESYVTGISSTGYVVGDSRRFIRREGAWEEPASQFEAGGKGAWVTNAATGETFRVGLFQGSEYSFRTGAQWSEAMGVSDRGYVTGVSTRYNQNGTNGEATWVADARTGVTSRVGLYDGPEFTSSTQGYQHSFMGGGTGDTDYVWGVSFRYKGDGYNGVASWVANMQTGVTKRIGILNGTESAEGSDYQSSYIIKSTRSGYAIGSTTFGIEPSNVSSLWIANAETGITTRIGLHEGPEFTSASGKQISTEQFLTESGYASGYSSRFSEETDLGQAAWAVDIRTGITTKIGLYDDRHTGDNGYQYSETTFLSESGLVAGFSVLNQWGYWMPELSTAWVFDLVSNTLITFDFRQDPTDFSVSSILGITADGFVYGSSEYFNETMETSSQHAFVWSRDTGTILLNEEISGGIGQYGWHSFFNATAVSSDQVVVGTGYLYGEGGNALYAVRVVPEPATALLVLLGLGGMMARRQRRR